MGCRACFCHAHSQQSGSCHIENFQSSSPINHDYSRNRLPHAIAVTPADATDRKGALLALGPHAIHLQAVEGVLADGGVNWSAIRAGRRRFPRAQMQIAKRSELQSFSVMPQRWVVERSFAWIDKCRRLWRDCERKLNTSSQFVHLAFLALLLRRS